MKIAIIGGGFFGCYLTKAINKSFGKDAEISIFDRENQLMTRAATNNQCRLHLGFHYPRSLETIKQTVEGFADFSTEFKENIYFPSKNYYAIHKGGLVNFEQYLKAMDEFNLEYKICDKSVMKYFKKPDDILGVLQVGEGVIKLQLLREDLLRSLSARVYNNCVVSEVDPDTGIIIVDGNKEGPFDYVINTTYVDPNLGLPDHEKYQVKFELTGMVLLKSPFNELAITIMDGQYISLYPVGRGLATLSSVKYTPFLRCSTNNEIEDAITNSNKIVKERRVIENIMGHGEELLNMELFETEVRGLWIAPKTKILDDVGNTRISDIKEYKRLRSVLCGKLDSVHKIAESIIKSLN